MSSNHVKIKSEKGALRPKKTIEEKELCAYLPDRVEVIKQAFSSLRSRELLAIVPPALRSIPVSTLREMCLDEILGISSKRLRSIIDGTECPTDTDTSSDESDEEKRPSEILETISLDSISSAEDDLIAHGKNKSKHHKKRKNKNKSKGTKQTAQSSIEANASESGMTVLELLELQARARAIRAQLAAVCGGNAGASDDDDDDSGSDSEVLIKEEPPVVVEIASSEDEDKDIKDEDANSKPSENIPESRTNVENSKNQQSTSSTTDDHSKSKSKRIKLNRNSSLTSSIINNSKEPISQETSNGSPKDKPEDSAPIKASTRQETAPAKRPAVQEKKKPKVKKYRKSNTIIEDDEITLNVSDSEKMDLFEISDSSEEENEEVENIETIEKVEEDIVKPTDIEDQEKEILESYPEKNNSENIVESFENSDKPIEEILIENVEQTTENLSMEDQKNKDEDKELSDGECSESSDDIEITEIKSDIVCISDDDKPEKLESPLKSKKTKSKKAKNKEKSEALNIMEISDDTSEDESRSSNYLSKEPTTAEIEELSKKVDSEIEREEIVLSKNVCGDVGDEIQPENETANEKDTPLGSWKERWLESTKVKKVMATSNLFNALRKKNKELKRKLAENAKLLEEEEKKEKEKAEEVQPIVPTEPEVALDEGSIDHYNTLIGSTKYVDPVPEPGTELEKAAETEKPVEEPDQCVKDASSMAKDAKELMRMYKKLLKINKRKTETESERKERKKKKKEKKEKKRKKQAEADEKTVEEQTLPQEQSLLENPVVTETPEKAGSDQENSPVPEKVVEETKEPEADSSIPKEQDSNDNSQETKSDEVVADL